MIYDSMKVAIKIIDHSTRRVSGSIPIKNGNFCDIEVTKDDVVIVIRVLNMFKENLEAVIDKLVSQGMDGKIWIKIWSHGIFHWGIINHGPIPDDWLTEKLLWGSDNLPPVDIAKQIYEFFGDDTNEIERFTNPNMYWARRGYEYEDGWIKVV